MKRIFLASTALTTVGLLVDRAAANDGIELELGGSYEAAAGVALGEDFSPSSALSAGSLRDYVFKQDVEIHFEGHTTLDNGLTVGAAVELEGQTDEEQVDSVYAYFSGGFGEIRFGDTEEAYAQLCYLVPSASELFGADSPDINFSNAGIAGYAATNGTCYGLDDNSTKVVYFSPVFAGFRFAASYTPDNTEDTRNTLDGAATRFRNDADQNSENLSLAASLTREFDAVSLVLGGGGTFSFNKEANPDNVDRARGYNAYVQIEIAGLALGAATELRQNYGMDGSDQWVYGAGVTYEWDDWTVGIGWTHGSYEGAVGANDVGPFNADHDDYALTASYELAPGISLDGVLEYSNYVSRDFAGPDYQGLAAGIGTLIAF